MIVRDPVDDLRPDDLSHRPNRTDPPRSREHLAHPCAREFTRTAVSGPAQHNFYTRDVTELRNDFPAGVLTGDAVAQLFAFAKSEQFAIPGGQLHRHPTR